MVAEKESMKETIKTKLTSNKKDTGSTEALIAIFTDRIKNITEHLKSNKKDNSGRRGLVILVSKRRKLLNYLKKKNLDNYKTVLEKYKIRK